MTVFDTLVALAGAILIGYTLLSAIRAVIMPRGEITMLTALVFRPLGLIFRAVSDRRGTFEGKDRTMALFAPVALLLLPAMWVSLVLVGFMAVFWGIGGYTLEEAFTISGSSLLTLGFAPVDPVPEKILVFLEATMGLGIVALLITFLPSLYQAFSRRETLVGLLEVRAGSPPSAEEFLLRHFRILDLGGLSREWESWERWFVEIEESHVSYPALVFFRSPRPDRSWITACGTVLDSAALTLSSLDMAPQPQAALMIRAGYLSLRQICDYFNLHYPDDPDPTDPISISRGEFDATLDRLAIEGLPVKGDRDQAWKDFAGWRVNYDAPVLGLAQLVVAPFATWNSDRPPLAGQRKGIPRFGRLRRRLLDENRETVDG